MRVIRIIDHRRIRGPFARFARGEGNAVIWAIIPSAASTIPQGIFLRYGAVKTDIKAAKTVDTAKKIRIYIIVKTIAVALTARAGTGGRHKVRLIHGRKEVLPGDFSPTHGEGRHVLAGIGRIKIFELKGATVFKGDDEIIATPGKRGLIGGKFKNKAGIGSTDNVLGSSRNRPGKSYVSHDNLLRREKNGWGNGGRKKPCTGEEASAGLIQAEE